MCPIPRTVTPPPQEEEEAPQEPSTEVKAGQSLPPLPAGSKIDIPSAKLRRINALVDETMISEELKDPGSRIWKSDRDLTQALKQILPRGKKRCLSRRVPQCLLLDAPSLLEKLIVINWWLDIEDKTAAFQTLKATYKRPTVSNDRFPPHANIIMASDKQERLDEHAANTASGQRMKRKERNYRTLEDDIDHPRQAMAKPLRLLHMKIEKDIGKFMDLTKNLPAGCRYEVGLVTKRNMGTPQKTGITATSDLMLEQDKTIVFARDQEAARYLFEDASTWGAEESQPAENTAESQRAENTTIVYRDAQDKTYLQAQAKTRARETFKTLEEVNVDSSYTSCTIRIGDDF